MKSPTKIFLLTFLFLLPFYTYSQNQWRVFTTQNSGLPDNNILCIGIDTNNNKWIGTQNGLVKYNGSNWIVYDTSNSPLPVAAITSIAVDKLNNLWLGSSYGGGLVKFDGVNNWTIYNTTNSGMPSNYIFVIKIDFNNIKWIGGFGLTKFNDTNWVIYNSTNSGLPHNLVSALELERHIKWIGHFTILVDAGLTKFNDTSWIVYNENNSGLPSNLVEDINLDKFNNKWIATRFGGLAKFNSVSNIWTVYNTSNSGLTEDNLRCIKTDRNNIKFIGPSSSGLNIYNDTTWINYNDTNSPMPSNSISNISIDSLNNKWLATSGGLVIFNEYGIIGIKNLNNLIPNRLKLFQNYPNPFNSQTKIKLQIYNTSNIRLTVYNILGEEITTLINQQLNPGLYEVVFDGTNYPSGVYFYQLLVINKQQVIEFTDTKKLILIK